MGVSAWQITTAEVKSYTPTNTTDLLDRRSVAYYPLSFSSMSGQKLFMLLARKEDSLTDRVPA